MDIGGCALVTVITYFFCNLWRSGAFPLSTPREFTCISSRSAISYFSQLVKNVSCKREFTINWWGWGGKGTCVLYVKHIPSPSLRSEHRKAIYLIQVTPCSPCGTILLRTKLICSKRMRRLVSVRGF